MPESRDLERRLLLAALHPAAPDFPALLAESGTRLNWSWLLDRATEHKVAALLAWRLDEEAFAKHLPSRVQARLVAIERAARRRAAQAARTLQQVAGALDAARIPFLLIKGSILSEHVYRQPTIRPFNDVDLVVRQGMLDAAEDTLRAVGYSFMAPTAHHLETFGMIDDAHSGGVVPESLGRTFYSEKHFHFQLAPPAADRLPLELHWQLARPGLLRQSEAQLWAETCSLTISGTRVSCLCGDAMIVHAGTHAINHGRSEARLLHLADVAWLLDRAPMPWRPDRVWELARQWGATGDLSCALMLVDDLFGYRHPELSPPGGGRQRMRRAALRVIGAPTTLVDRDAPPGGASRLLHDVFGEGAWELCEGRWPQRAAVRAMNAVRAKVNEMRRRIGPGRTRDGVPTPASSACESAAVPDEVEVLVAGMGRSIAQALDLHANQSSTGRSFLIQLEGGGDLKGRLMPSDAEADRLALLSANLADEPFPQLLGRSGRALLFEWIDGDTFAGETRDLDAFRDCGALLAHVHGLSVSSMPVPTRSAADVRDRLPQAMEQLVASQALTRGAAQQTTRLALAHTPASVPVGCTYADFCGERILVDWVGELYLSDVGRLVVEALDYDLALVSQRWTMSSSEREAFLSGYAKTRSLESFKEYRLFWTILARAETELSRREGTSEVVGETVRPIL